LQFVFYINFLFNYRDGYLKEWDLRTLTCLREIKCHNGAVNGIEITDIKIVTCGGDKLARIWEMTTPIDKSPRESQ
jgi:WD40 repeat protein